MHIEQDNRVDFPAYFVTGEGKTQQRKYMAGLAISWLSVQHERGAKGAIMVDIDDTLMDGNESVLNGFQYMHDLYINGGMLYPIHVVTARPDDDHGFGHGGLPRLNYVRSAWP